MHSLATTIVKAREMKILIIFLFSLRWQNTISVFERNLNVVERNKNEQNTGFQAHGSNVLETTSAKTKKSRAQMQRLLEDNDNGEHRYIVKFKDGSKLYSNRMQHTRRKLNVNSEHTLGLDHNFMPFDNVEVMTLDTQEEVEEWENNTEVDFVEKGKQR